ncbi:hypothetical protein FM036_32710 [Nostoc sp. HG1]|nr:hypothetical protein [Nostoc sp. HG1]MCY7275297.1 hypothetical protein [Phormidesmis sp. CAN_BIN44]
MAVYQIALRINSNCAEAHANLGIALVKRDMQRAEECALRS